MNLVLMLVLSATAFADPMIPCPETLAYLANDFGKLVPIEHNTDLVGDCYVTRHTDTTGLVVITTIDRATLATRRVAKFRHGKPTLEVRVEPGRATVTSYPSGRVRRFAVRGPCYDRHTLYEVLRGYPFTNPRKVGLPLLVPEFGVLTVEVRPLGVERIRTPVGDFNCWKLCLLAPGIAGVVYSKKFYFWYAQNEPHRLVFYQDSDGRESKLMRAVTGIVNR